MTNTPKAVVLLSGGLDSATALAEAKAAGFETYALTVLYGQRHAVEREAARRVARALGVARHVEQQIDLRAFGGSALTADLDVPKDRSADEMGAGIPITYVPARNTVFLALALAWAETLGAFDLFVGVNCVDYSGYPDCRPEYLHAFEALANLATRAGVEFRGEGRGTRGESESGQGGGARREPDPARPSPLSGSPLAGPFRVHAPLITLTKDQIIRRGLELGVDYGLTHSCYDPAPDGRACGRCDSCRLRLDAFARLGLTDPVAYIR
jgi:7-cyano-7-deazaguanine synthase